METTYTPNRTKGMRFLIILAGLIATSLGFSMVRSGSEQNQNLFFVWVGLAIVLMIPLALLLYRAYTLGTTRYILSRDALDLRWGLRRELIPLNQVEWARPQTDFQSKLPLPWFRLPGSIFSKLDITGLGPTQFLAVSPINNILVNTRRQTYVISPQESSKFVQEIKRYSEFGQSRPVEPLSTSFATIWSDIWRDERAKTFITLGLILVGVAWLTAAGLIATFPQVTWVDLTMVPSNRLVLPAILATLFWLADLATGLFFYLRGSVAKPLIYLLWAASFVTSVILIAAMFLLAI